MSEEHPTLPHRQLQDGSFEIFDPRWKEYHTVEYLEREYNRYIADHCPECPAPVSLDEYLITKTVPRDERRQKEHSQRI